MSQRPTGRKRIQSREVCGWTFQTTRNFEKAKNTKHELFPTQHAVID